MSQPLDARLDKIEASQSRLHDLISEIEDILETLIANDTEILEALAQILLVMPQMQDRAEQNQGRLLEEVRKELREFTRELSQQNAVQSSGSGKAIVIESDPFLAENPEVGLLQHLYSFLPEPIALDIGANSGNVSERLLQTGYEVFAFEPNPPMFEILRQKLAGEKGFHAFPCALGSSEGTMDLHVAADPKGAKKYGDPALFSSLVDHPMPPDLPFTHHVPVPVRTIEKLRLFGEIPARAGVIKIDTEGFDLEVIRGLGPDETPIVMTEFWDATHWFGRSGKSRLEDTVREMRSRGYGRYLVIYRQDATSTLSYYCNRFQTPPDSWGNAVFFRDHELFAHAHRWCESTLIATVLQ